MKGKVLCAILVYNERTYCKGDYIEVTDNAKMQMLIASRSITEIIEKKAEVRPTNGNLKSQGGVRRK